ncbi:hypothetical protein N7474_002090 [Penicillium riverlandense]|uniref:uncharacterized protein n=1 Tax=Penicillium riverlandense TaxID=1903569 RepID=UPI002549BA3E|nr:uncharacterized protein N7474_002090 [Penicillium riverlandense]KAJ5833779.1 hypothetical protein N7474_002090 [Penicillium riverlandense]
MLDKFARTDLRSTTEYEAIVSYPRAARYAAAMMHQTGILGQFRHIEREPDDDDPERIGLAAMDYATMINRRFGALGQANKGKARARYGDERRQKK